MKIGKYTTALILLAVVMAALSGCAAPDGPLAQNSTAGGPTMTAIPLPTWTPTSLDKVETDNTQPTAEHTTIRVSNPTPSPEPTATATSTAPAQVVEATAEPIAEPTATAPAKAKAKSSKPSGLTGKLVFQTTIGGDLYTIDADGSGLQRITDGVDPVWSPDGRQIAFTRWRDPRGVWVVDMSTGDEWRAFDWSEARWPSWSPAGQEIMFSRQNGGRPERERCFWGFCFTIPAKSRWNLGIVRPDGGDFHEPPAPNLVLAPDWSPTGERLVYDGEHGLMVQSVDGEVSYQISDDARDSGPIWSPDGTRVAFTRRQHDHWEIYVVDADGGNLTRLTKTPDRPDEQPGNSAAPAWSPSGDQIAFFTDRTGQWQIWVMAAGGGRPKPMFETELDGLALEYSSVAERAISWTE